jgi:hypothetical protein
MDTSYWVEDEMADEEIEELLSPENLKELMQDLEMKAAGHPKQDTIVKIVLLSKGILALYEQEKDDPCSDGFHKLTVLLLGAAVYYLEGPSGSATIISNESKYVM